MENKVMITKCSLFIKYQRMEYKVMITKDSLFIKY